MIKVLTENLIGRKARAALFRTWGSMVQMQPVGGAAVWGNATWAPDNTPALRAAGASAGALVTLTGAGGSQVLDVDAVAAKVFEDAMPAMVAAGQTWLGGSGPQEPLTLRDPTVTPLPRAPSLRVFCLYGVGLPSDRALHYTTAEDGSKQIKSDVHTPSMGLVCGRRRHIVFQNPTARGQQEHGVLSVDGDGTVPLLSLGAMCRQPWAHGSPLNPGNTTVTTKEYRHDGGAAFSFQLQCVLYGIAIILLWALCMCFSQGRSGLSGTRGHPCQPRAPSRRGGTGCGAS